MSRLTAPDRLRRLLAIVPWVASVNGATLDEIAERFDYPRSRLERDLFDVVQFVGVYPYTPDQLIEVFIDPDSGLVSINYADYFRQPLRLTPEEALALVGAGAGLIDGADVGDSPLATGIAKLAAKLGVEVGETVEIQLGSAAPDVLATTRAAVDNHTRVRLDYYSHGRDQRTQREVDPYRLFAQGGAWYLNGYCHTAEDARVFRLDRIHEITLTDVSFDLPVEAVEESFFDPDPDDPRVTLELAPAAAWVAGYYPHEEREALPDGSVRVRLAVTATSWLERILLQLGPHATVREDESDLGSGVAAAAAARVLERYRSASSSS